MAWLSAGCAHHPAVTPSPAPVSDVVTARPQPAAAPGPAVEAQAKEDLAALLRQSVIHFGFDAKQLSTESLARLDRLAEALRAHPDARILVSGNCDDRGTEEYNFALGQERAAAAKRYLVDLGIAPQRIELVSGGEERPVDPREADEAWAANRRDEFSLIGSR